MSAPRIYTVEGNIGSGKSTFVKNLQHWFNTNHPYEKVVFLQEPVDDWVSIKDTNDETIIEKFYKDQKTYAFSFQMMAYISRLAILKKTVEENPGAIIITERSLYTDKEVFAKMLYEDNKIDDVQYQIYLKWFDFFQKEYPLEGIIYLSTDYKTCFNRIELRDRDGENKITLAYLQLCNEYHNKWIYKDPFRKDVLEIDVTAQITDKVKENWFTQVYNFVSKTHSKYHYANCI